jgi:hypothetical protein
MVCPLLFAQLLLFKIYPVGGAITILKNMSSPMGRMTSHMKWIIKNVPNHQPVINPTV